ncbi:hypothetical protein ACWDA9_04275, partial [Streptomyces sp. NPDC001193]
MTDQSPEPNDPWAPPERPAVELGKPQATPGVSGPPSVHDQQTVAGMPGGDTPPAQIPGPALPPAYGYPAQPDPGGYAYPGPPPAQPTYGHPGHPGQCTRLQDSLAAGESGLLETGIEELLR